jgi:hypothetical protein
VESDPAGLRAGVNTYAFVLANPLSVTDPSGLSSVIYNRSDGTVTIVNGAGEAVGTFPAANDAATGSRGPWPNGDYTYAYHTTHPDDATDSPYGSYGNYVFNLPGCVGCGIHSGRANSTDRAGRSGVKYATEGCIRTTDAATGLLTQLIASGDPLTGLIVTGSFIPTNPIPVSPSLAGPSPVYLPDTRP